MHLNLISNEIYNKKHKTIILFFIYLLMDYLYPLFSQFILITISVIIFISMAIAFRKIMKDINDILDSTDKFIFFIAALQCTKF